VNVDVVIRGGRVVTADGSFDADVGIVGERIAALSAGGLRGREEIDARGLYVLPGAVDAHVHLDDPASPPDLLADTLGSAPGLAHDFATGTRAAARGGVTTLVDFAMPPPGESLVEGLRRRLEHASRSVIDVGLHATVRDAAPERLAELRQRLRSAPQQDEDEDHDKDDHQVRHVVRMVLRDAPPERPYHFTVSPC
jgi:dihydropyrimidinase